MCTSTLRVCRGSLGMMAGSIAWSCLVLALLAGIARGQDNDRVLVQHPDGTGTRERRGEILDYTGRALTLRLPGGREATIPAEQVMDMETATSADQQNADQLLAEGRFADALQSYRQAVDSEPRAWMRRIILGQMVRCYRNQGQIAAAVDTFLIIVRSDPETQLFAEIPLAWTARQPAPQLARRAAGWRDDVDNSVAALLGASWLLSGSERSASAAVLGRLVSEAGSPVSWLAETQLWRTQVATVAKAELPQWRQRMENLPESLRAGPYFVLGRALAQQQEHERAAMAFMRVPILFDQERDLAAESLLAAGEQLKRAGQLQESRRVYGELISQYKGHRLVPVVQRLLEQEDE